MATARTQLVKNHQVWADLNSLDQQLEQAGLLLPSEDPEIESGYLSLQALAKHTRTVLKSMNALITPLPQLDAVDSAIQSIMSSVASANSHGDGAQLLTAWTQADALLTALSRLPVVKSRHDAMAMTEAIAQVQQQSEEALEAFAGQAEQLGAEIAAVDTRQSLLSSEIAEQKAMATQALGQLEDSIATAIEGFDTRLTSMQETRESQAATAFAALQSRLDAAETKATNFYGSDLARHTSQMETFREEFDRARTLFDTQTAEAEEAYVERADSTIAALKAELEEAKKLVGMIGEVTMTGHYQRNAAEQKKAADLWTIATVAATALTVAWAVGLSLYGLSHPADRGWFDYVSRIGATIAFGALAGYLGLQARNHRQRETNYRALELELATLDPFISTMSDEEQQRIKAELAMRYFPGIDPEPIKLD